MPFLGSPAAAVAAVGWTNHVAWEEKKRRGSESQRVVEARQKRWTKTFADSSAVVHDVDDDDDDSDADADVVDVVFVNLVPIVVAAADAERYLP